MASLRLRSTTSILRFGAIIAVNKGFLNKNTAITRQLIRTARMLEAEWWLVCREAWVRGQRERSQVLGAFGLLDFTMLGPFLAWRAFRNFVPFISLIFHYFRAAANCGYGLFAVSSPPHRGSVYTRQLSVF